MRLEENKTYGLVGESGSGKTSLIEGILQLHNKNHCRVEGQAFFNGKDLVKLGPKDLNRIRWEEISIVFQNSMNTLSPIHKIFTQICDIYWAHFQNTPKNQVKSEVLSIFELLNLKESVLYSYPHELSGGMMQRVSIALSLVFNPQVIIFDEATTALDIITQNKILSELKALDQVYSNTKVFVTHDLSVVRQTCDEVFVMYHGEIIEQGSVDTIFNHPNHSYTQSLVMNFKKLNE